MPDTIEPTFVPQEVGHEILDPRIHDDGGDPHRAALEDADASGKVSTTTWAAVFFLGISLLSAITFTLSTFVPIATLVSLDLQGNLDNVNWIAGGWSLGGSVTFAVAGQLSDYLGRKEIIIVGQCCLILGHLLGATAYSFSQLIAAMSILGVGAGMTFVGYPGISEILPNKWRGFGLATTEVFVSVLGTFCPLIGRRLNTEATWRWVFIIGDISAVVSTIGTLLFYHPPRRIFRDRTKMQILVELDYVGIFLFTVGVAVFLLGLGWIGTEYSATSPAVIVSVVLGGTMIIATFIWDFYGNTTRPLFARRLLRQFRPYTSLIVINFATGLAHIALTTFVPQQIIEVFTSDPTTAGWYNVPSGIGASFGGIVIGGLISRIKYIHIQLLVANFLQTLCTGLLAYVNPDRVVAALILQGFANVSFEWILVISYTTAGLHVQQRDIGLAYGLLGSSRYFGGAIGSTILNTVLRNKAKITVASRVIAAVVPLGFEPSHVGELIAVLSNHGPPAALAKFSPAVLAAATKAMRWGNSDAFNFVWYTSLPFSIVACIVSPFVLDPSSYFTNHTAVTSTTRDVSGGVDQKPQGEDENGKDVPSVTHQA